MKFGHNIPEINKKKNRDHFFEILIFGRSGFKKHNFGQGGIKNTLKSSKIKKIKILVPIYFSYIFQVYCVQVS